LKLKRLGGKSWFPPGLLRDAVDAATAPRFSVSNPINIEQNIRAGAEYPSCLSQLFNRDLRLALATYAAGERRVLRRGLAHSHPEALAYVLRGQTGAFGEA
jgi:soluble lytic murein transglycosylase-like protein